MIREEKEFKSAFSTAHVRPYVPCHDGGLAAGTGAQQRTDGVLSDDLIPVSVL